MPPDPVIHSNQPSAADSPFDVAIFTAMTMSVNPPSNVEHVDPKTLHLSGEFAEHNLGTSVAADGSVTARVIATQFMLRALHEGLEIDRVVFDALVALRAR